jgi:hypothetical protein
MLTKSSCQVVVVRGNRIFGLDGRPADGNVSHSSLLLTRQASRPPSSSTLEPGPFCSSHLTFNLEDSISDDSDTILSAVEDCQGGEKRLHSLR